MIVMNLLVGDPISVFIEFPISIDICVIGTPKIDFILKSVSTPTSYGKLHNTEIYKEIIKSKCT